MVYIQQPFHYFEQTMSTLADVQALMCTNKTWSMLSPDIVELIRESKFIHPTARLINHLNFEWNGWCLDITSNAMIAAHESFNLSIIGTYTVLSKGNLHIFQTVFSSISTITISLDILLG